MVMAAIDHLPDDYLSKPFTKNQLQSRLQKQMEKKDSLVEISKAIFEKDYMQAISLCDIQISSMPKNRMELLKTKAELLMKLGKYEECEILCNNLLTQRDIPWVMMSLGQAHFYQENMKKPKKYSKR